MNDLRNDPWVQTSSISTMTTFTAIDNFGPLDEYEDQELLSELDELKSVINRLHPTGPAFELQGEA